MYKSAATLNPNVIFATNIHCLQILNLRLILPKTFAICDFQLDKFCDGNRTPPNT